VKIIEGTAKQEDIDNFKNMQKMEGGRLDKK
jgi:hypothetical protein